MQGIKGIKGWAGDRLPIPLSYTSFVFHARRFYCVCVTGEPSLLQIHLRNGLIRAQSELYRQRAGHRSVDVPNSISIDRNIINIISVIVGRYRNVAVLAPVQRQELPIQKEIPVSLGGPEHRGVLTVIAVVIGMD